MTFDEVTSRFEAKCNGKEWSAHCPAHKDTNASLSITEGRDGRTLLHCHAGCKPEAVVIAAGLIMADLFPSIGSPVQLRMVKTYDYPDDDGKLLFQVCRFEPKDFRQRRPDGHGGWIWNLQGVDRVLYCLTRILVGVKAGQVIYLAEGEKDVDALSGLGLYATCNSGGAGKWQASYTDSLAGADVVIIADKDKAGRDHAEAVATALHGKTASVKVLELPDRDGCAVKDPADWIAAGGTVTELNVLVEAAPAWTPPAVPPAPVAVHAGMGNNQFIILPGGGVTITNCAEIVFQQIAPTHELFIRGGAVMELRQDDAGGLRLDVLRAQAFRSRIEKLGTLVAWRIGGGGQPVLKPSICPADMAEALLESETAECLLPKVRGLVACPVLAEEAGQLRVLAKGYHAANGGLLVTAGKTPPEMEIVEAIEVLRLLVADFDFSTPGDRSRALASFITPALRLGGWLRGHIPIDIAEADQSQSGKTYRQKVVFALYGEEPYRIALRDGGVGGLDESIAQALIAGRPFIQVDNVRGRIESQFIEMMTTAGGCIGARVPHRGEVQVDSRHFLLMMTSNGVETTRDLANRSSIIRIRKRPGCTFLEFPEGDLLAHVHANQARFLGAVFAVIRAWSTAGKPKTGEKRHDFREWAQVLDWIVQHVLAEAPLIDGHTAAQERVSNPALTWLRRVALAIEADHRMDEEIMAGSIGELCEDHNIDIPGLRDTADEVGRNKRVGILMKKAFGEGEEIKIDRYHVKRTEKEHYYVASQENKMIKAYVFTLMVANSPELPEQPEQPLLLSKNTPHFPESIDPYSGYSGNSGNASVEDEERAAIMAEGSLNL